MGWVVGKMKLIGKGGMVEGKGVLLWDDCMVGGSEVGENVKIV